MSWTMLDNLHRQHLRQVPNSVCISFSCRRQISIHIPHDEFVATLTGMIVHNIKEIGVFLHGNEWRSIDDTDQMGGETPFCTQQNKYSGSAGFPSPRVLDDATIVMLKSSRTNTATPPPFLLRSCLITSSLLSEWDRCRQLGPTMTPLCQKSGRRGSLPDTCEDYLFMA